MVFLLLYIFANGRLFQTNGADTISASPETATKQGAFELRDVSMNPNRTLAFEVPNRHRDAIPRRYAQQHMYVIRHCFAFQKLDFFLATQIPKNLANFPTNASIQCLFAVFWLYYHMILTLPLHVGLTLPIFHDGSPCPAGPSSRENHYKHAGTAEPFEFSPAELVDYC